jgi:Protein of unknown function (DUF4235)
VKLIYKPFGIIIGIVAGIIGRQVFTFIWGKIDDEEAPKPDTELAPWTKVIGAAFVQGATFAVVKAIAKRGSAKGFAHLTGVWPGEHRPDPE